MKIFVKAKVNARQNLVEKTDDTHYIISVKEPPHDNKANIAIIKELANFYQVPISSVSLISGHNYKQKVFKVNLLCNRKHNPTLGVD